MFRAFSFALVLMFLIPTLLFAQSGKLRGKVSDRESGEPLIGANVVLDGTTMGASTDINGEYIILNVPPGVYTIKSSYIGYTPFAMSNVRVSSNLTTTQDVALNKASLEMREVVVIAERPLVQRNTTNTIRLMTQEDIRDLPVRTINTFVSMQAGVVERDGRLYVRGGRSGEISYYVDGANVTNPIRREATVGVIQEAMEEIQLQSGGYTAEFGGANSGIVRTTVRTGGPDLRWTVDYQTDDFAKPGSQFLGTSAYGYRNGVVTVGGPLMNGIRFFLIGQHNYTRQNQRIFLEPFSFDSLRTDALGNRPAGQLLPNGGAIEFKQNYLYNNWNFTNNGIGTVLLDLNQMVQVPVKLKFTGSYSFAQTPNNTGWTAGVTNYYRNPRLIQLNETEIAFANVRLTHILGPSTFYEVGLSYQNRFVRNYLPDFGDDWKTYADSLTYNQKGFNTSNWRSRYEGPYGYSTVFQFPSSAGFTAPDAPNVGYSKTNTRQFGLTIDFTSQITSRWEFKAGGNIDSWVYRSYNTNAQTYDLFLDPNKTGTFRTFPTDYERRVRLIRAVITNIGYDLDGNLSDGLSYTLPDGAVSTLDGPRKPLFASAYVQNKLEYHDLILNVGARFEYFDPKMLNVPQTVNPVTGVADYSDPPTDDALNVLQEDKLTYVDPTSYVLPRLNFAFPVTDRTVFYAQYGKYAQIPRLDQFYTDPVTLSGLVSKQSRTSTNLGGAVVGFLAKPERNTQYEMGVRQTLSDNFALTFSGFYKDLKDQIQLRRIYSSDGLPIFVGFTNQDFGTIKGLETTLELRRTNRFAARMNYTLSDARGTGSSPTSAQNAVTDDASARFPNFINPLDYNETHRGTLNLDYRFARGDGGPVLEGMGLDLLITFNSGHSYTKIKEPQNLGQASPWNVGVRALIDSRNRNPVEPINASSTPWVFNVDMNFSKVFFLENFNVELYAHVLNLFNTKSIFNVYPTTGTPTDDGWLKSPFAAPYRAIPKYVAFYQAFNVNNRYAYDQIGAGGGLGAQAGGDLYGPPRQIILGLRIEM